MPDLAVICNPNKLHEQYCFGAPTVVMEILFPSTVKADRLVKLNRYQQAGVPEYWIVLPQEQNATVFVLENAGVTVTKAVNGQDALDQFAASAPGTFDAIIMDVMMPVMDGYQATRAIRQLDRPDAGSIPILAMTANAFVEDRRRAYEAGMNEHLTKPLEPEVVLRTLAKYRSK